VVEFLEDRTMNFQNLRIPKKLPTFDIFAFPFESIRHHSQQSITEKVLSVNFIIFDRSDMITTTVICYLISY